MSEKPSPFIRQQDLLPSSLSANRVTIVGVGAIGRQVAVNLAHIGVEHFQLIDPDIVEIENLGPQGFKLSDLGLSKVGAVSQTIEDLNPEAEVSLIPQYYSPGYVRRFKPFAVFSCVDKMDARRSVFEGTTPIPSVKFWADGRMLSETMRILTVLPEKPRSLDYYSSTLFPEREIVPGSCTARSTYYCASIAGSLLVSQYTKYLRDLPLISYDFMVDLISMSFNLSPPRLDTTARQDYTQ